MSFTAICSTICCETGHVSSSPGPSWLQPRRVTSALRDQLEPAPKEPPMKATAPTRPTELQERRVRLAARPAAVAEARSQVRAAICAWDVPVDPDIAVLLASELVTNAVRHEP